jgi:hypothetical protein
MQSDYNSWEICEKLDLDSDWIRENLGLKPINFFREKNIFTYFFVIRPLF